MVYDSTKDTQAHIARVYELLEWFSVELLKRGKEHDSSKLKAPEKEIFDEFTPKLKDADYGSDEYKGFLKDMQVALDHHYKENSHHPEHYEDGVKGMNLFDIIEMFLDWKAATERHDSGDITKSIEFNKKRFEYDDTLEAIFKNTVKYLPETELKHLDK